MTRLARTLAAATACALACTVPAVATPSAAAPAAVPAYTTMFNEAEQSGSLFHPGGDVVDFDMSDDGTVMATLLADGDYRWVWRRDDNHELRFLRIDGSQEASNVGGVAVSPSGRYIAFHSNSPTAGGGVNSAGRYTVIYRYDTQTDTTVAMSADPTAPLFDAVNPSVADDGSVAYLAKPLDSTHVQAWVSTGPGSVGLVSQTADGGYWTADVTTVAASVSSDGSPHVAFASAGEDPIDAVEDTNGVSDVMLYDGTTGIVEYLTATGGVADGGTITRHALNADATQIAVTTTTWGGADAGAPDVYIVNVDTGARTRVSTFATGSYSTARMAGSNVAFLGTQSPVGYADGSTDTSTDPARAFMYDAATSRALRTSFDAAGGKLDAAVIAASVTADGAASMWASSATDAVSPDTSAYAGDVFRTAVPASLATVSSVQRTAYTDAGTAAVTLSGAGITPGMRASSSSSDVDASAVATAAAADGTGTATVSYDPVGTLTDLDPVVVTLTNLFGDSAPLLEVTVVPVYQTAMSIAQPTAFTSGPRAVTVTLTAMMGGAQAPVNAQPVAFSTSRDGGATWTVAGQATTDSAGRASFSVANPGGPVHVRAAYAGERGELIAYQSSASDAVVIAHPVTWTAPVVTVTGTRAVVTAEISPVAASTGGTVQLQRKSGASWATIGTSSVTGGRVSVSGTLPSGAQTLRLSYSNTSAGWAASVSASVTATPALTVTTGRRTVKSGVLTVKSTVSPAVSGAPVTLQRLVKGKWTTVATAKQGATGAASLTWKMVRGTSTLRVAAPAAGGYAAVTGAQFTARR